MNIERNSLIQWATEQGEPKVERVLFVDPAHKNIVAIDIADQHAQPKWLKVTDVERAIEKCEARVLMHDPYASLLLPENDIKPSHRKRRDDAYVFIATLVEDHVPGIFDPAQRGSLITIASQRVIDGKGRSEVSIRKALRRYWQCGQIKNCLLPFYHLSGGRGKERRSEGVKRGRRNKDALITGQVTGINIGPEERDKFRRGFKKFYQTPEQRTLPEVFDLTKEEFFNAGYEKRHGVLVPVLPPADQLPTYGQFVYWVKKENDAKRTIISREGQRRFETNHRPVVGDAMQMAYGPGSVFQIDACVGNIYLVSQLDPNRIIGRPVIYVVQDAFSRLVVGFAATLEGPSWLGATLAIENTAMDKVELCKELGISIMEEEWPSHHLPEAILADRGELEGYNADNLVNSLGITLSNTAPYRADWKGMVEQQIRLTKDRIRWVPGEHRRRERGARDPRLDACLNLFDLRQLLIRIFLRHNQSRLKNYRMGEFMIKDRVEPIPAELWSWGISNRSGHLRTLPRDALRLNLLPRGVASIQHTGILFMGLHYTCELAEREQWYIRARTGRMEVPVAYDPRFLDVIYIVLEAHLERCTLLEVDKVFAGKDWYEAEEYFELQKQEARLDGTRRQELEAEFHAQKKEIIERAQRRKEGADSQMSNHARLADIKKNRLQERGREGRDEARRGMESVSNHQPGGGKPQAGQPSKREEGYVPIPQEVKLLEGIREEMLKDE